MAEKKTDMRTEWIFCRDIDGKCSGLNPKTKVLEKTPKNIRVNGREISGWLVKIVQEKTEGHIKLNMAEESKE